jgi:hypothetical protein
MFSSQASFLLHYAARFLEKPRRSRKTQNRMQEKHADTTSTRRSDRLLSPVAQFWIRAKYKLLSAEYLFCDAGLTVFKTIARKLIYQLINERNWLHGTGLPLFT